MKERAQFNPLSGEYRVFLVDGIDRAGEHAANSLLKTLEEPPSHLVLILTAQNPYDLLPTIRSRAAPFHLSPLDDDEMRAFAGKRDLANPSAVSRWPQVARASPSRLTWKPTTDAAQQCSSFSKWAPARRRSPSGRATQNRSLRRKPKNSNTIWKRSIFCWRMFWICSTKGSRLRNPDLRAELQSLAERVSFEWIRAAVRRTDELVELLRRNIQKGIALDALALELRAA